MPEAAQIFARVECVLSGRFRFLKGPDEALFRGVAHSGGLARVKLEQARLPEALTQFLLEMDNKLDAILAQLQGENLQSLFPEQIRVTLIGGNGVEFSVPGPATAGRLAEGVWLEAALQLSDFPLRVVFAAGALRALPGGAWAMGFDRIQEKDREEIIRFVLDEERRQIREKKR